MRRLTYYAATTMDGYIAAEDGSVGFFPVGGDHGPVIRSQYPETLPTKVREVFGISGPNTTFDTVLMGRKTYDFGVRTGTASPYTHLRQLVVSRTLPESPDPNIELVSDDPLARVRELKCEPGLGIWLCGGGELARELLPEIDQIFVKRYPVVLGGGRRLFGSGPMISPVVFHVTTSRMFSSGVALVKYSRTDTRRRLR
jgi:dihydrofolate reductase